MLPYRSPRVWELSWRSSQDCSPSSGGPQPLFEELTSHTSHGTGQKSTLDFAFLIQPSDCPTEGRVPGPAFRLAAWHCCLCRASTQGSHSYSFRTIHLPDPESSPSSSSCKAVLATRGPFPVSVNFRIIASLPRFLFPHSPLGDWFYWIGPQSWTGSNPCLVILTHPGSRHGLLSLI